MKSDLRRLAALPLFPLHAVLFPGGLLRLKVFEARYLDLVGQCLRDDTPFGVVCLIQGHEAQVQTGATAFAVRFESTGVLARVCQVDAEQAGILKIGCSGAERFVLTSPRQQTNGLWLADVALQDADPPQALPTASQPVADALRRAIESLAAQGQHPFVEPYRLDDAGWVANRWCEILPISLAARQKLMELGDPIQRLSLVDGYLRDKGVV